MRRFRVEYRRQAASDIEDIFDYVLERSADLLTAMRYTDRIFARCESIGDVPFGGVSRPDLGSGTRMVPFEKSAVILYIVEGETVVIVSVFAGGRDYEAIMREGR
jgi:toxin ParE1/3/4